MLSEGVHSGLAGGVVPSSFRLLRQLLSRIEDEATGEILVPECLAEPPARYLGAAETMATELGEAALGRVPDRPFARALRPGRCRPAPAAHLDALPGRDRYRWRAFFDRWRKRAAALHDGEALAPATSDCRPGTSRPSGGRQAVGRPATECAG